MQHRKHIRILLFLAAVFLSALPLAARSTAELDDSAPLLAPSVSSAEPSAQPPLFAGALSHVPAPPQSPSDEFRRTVHELQNRKHQYVHCKLKSGKILTGQIKDASATGFTIQTDAIFGLHDVKFDDLGESPRAVPAVGTRFKQGAQWVGVGVLVAVAVPILVVLSPLLYFSGAWQC